MIHTYEQEVFVIIKINFRKLLFFVAIPLVVGAVSALISMGSMDSFMNIPKPPLSPPSWLFPVVWTVLYILMGVASYLVAESETTKSIPLALGIYGIQLAFNFFWSIIFFNMQAYLFAFIWLLILWALIIVTIVLFYRINKTAGYLLIPYLLWVTFAGYLNLAIYLQGR